MNTRGIDSCKILIELSKCTFDTRLTKQVYEVYHDFADTGEIITVHQTKPLTIESLGFNTYYGIISLFGKQFIYILVNAKMLTTRYFESINKNTVSIIYNHVKMQGICNVSYDDFLNSGLTDVDIKTDFEMHDEPFMRMINERKKALVYPKLYSARPNLGIEYVKRSTATPSNPYVKYYSKSLELLTRSKEFKNAYFPDYINETLRRCEVTIKNYDHRKYIEKKMNILLPTTLGEWCSLTQDEYKAIIVHCVQQHEQHVQIPIDRKSYERNINSLTARDYLFYKMYNELKVHGLDDQQIIGMYDKRSDKSDTTHYAEKSRLNKLIRKIKEVSFETKRLENPF